MLRKAISVTAALLALAAPAEAQFSWPTSTPEAHGMSIARLDAMKEDLKGRSTSHFLVIRNDAIVYEWYAPGQSRTTNHYTASMAKAIVAGLSLGVALSDGRLSLDDKASKFVPGWAKDSVKSRILIRHLGSHTSGLEDAEEDKRPHERLNGWKGDFWKRPPPPADPFTLARDQAPLLFFPGDQFQYSNPGIAMLTYAVTASLKDAPQKDIRALLRERVLRPIGVPDGEWSCGYGQTITVEGLPLVGSWGGGNFSPNATARIARLMLRNGVWEGATLLQPSAVQAITGDAVPPGSVAQGWWTPAEGRIRKLPADAFWGAGAGHQVVIVVPSLSLIAVRYGEVLDATIDYHEALRRHFLEPLVGAVTLAPPCPQSPVIRGLHWAPASTIVRDARDSDTWPLTWGDDDHLYTAFGDGTGFDKTIPKLSMGLARIEGPPTGFHGVNIRSATGEHKGDGPKGRKASGMLMVDGALYMWVRNVDGRGNHCQLAWSADHGTSWTWSPWRFEEFGYPTFLNFGKNYAGSRDPYVYIYSHDNPSAYAPADRFILMRVPKDRIAERAAYEFLKPLDNSGRPTWAKEISERGAVFTLPGRCRRSAITYNAPLKRYLWWQMIHEEGVDHRFKGGFAIYDAPEPWGPWTTVTFTTGWDVGPGETASFPTKWMSEDGTSLYLVFSSEDSFAVRKATLVIGAPSSR